jgi:hypothetical protein
MIKYFQYSNIYVKNDEVAKTLTKVINSEGQKAISTYTEIGLYDSMIQKSNDWIESDAATFDSVKNQVIAYLQSV